MDLGIIGFGYWGKIIYHNLKQMGFRDITICDDDPQVLTSYQFGDKVKYIEDYTKLDCTHVFITTPASTHAEICHHCIDRIPNIFCEKPFTTNLKDHDRLAKRLENTNLFVDWIFHYNKGIDIIEERIGKLGPPANIIMNRLNFGPVRHDVNARLDLASHDVSIIQKLIQNQKLISKEWMDFKRNPHAQQNDSTVGILLFEHTCVQINASWHFGMKDRRCYFDFDDDVYVWDDKIKAITTQKSQKLYNTDNDPLKTAINSFLTDNDTRLQLETTRQIMEML